MTSTETTCQILEEFLSYPLHTADDIFARFEDLPGAIAGKGSTALERYVCIPGTLKNKIVLVAHTDTVWDDAYGKPAQTTVYFEDGLFKGTNSECGIGADDRAGCAMLWALRDCGHTLLLVNGEEKGKRGAKFLRKSNPTLFRFLNRHQFMIELDWRGTELCLFNQVDYTNRFYKYITKTLEFQDDKKPGGCDLQILCRRICGVNIGVGYHNWHRKEEYLSLAEWENTLSRLQQFLQLSHPKFPLSVVKKPLRFLVRVRNKICRIIKGLFPSYKNAD